MARKDKHESLAEESSQTQETVSPNRSSAHGSLKKSTRSSQSPTPKNAKFATLSDQLANMGLKLRMVLGDGNCLFRALGDQLDGNTRKHLDYRRQAVEHMRENRELFEPFIDDSISFERHVSLLGEPGTHAGNDAIVAFAGFHKAVVVVHQLNTPLYHIATQGFDDSRSLKELHVAYHNGEHYDSVRKLHEPDGLEVPACIHVSTIIRNPTVKQGISSVSDDVSVRYELVTLKSRIWDEDGSGRRIFGDDAADVAVTFPPEFRRSCERNPVSEHDSTWHKNYLVSMKYYEAEQTQTDGRPCAGLRADLKRCLAESDCVLKQKKTPLECLKSCDQSVSEECHVLRRAFFESDEVTLMFCVCSSWIIVYDLEVAEGIEMFQSTKRLEQVNIAGVESSVSSKTFILHGETHTLGNALRWMILKNPDVKFCGYNIPHPTEQKIQLSIQTTGVPAEKVLKRGLEDLHQLFGHILNTFEVKQALKDIRLSAAIAPRSITDFQFRNLSGSRVRIYFISSAYPGKGNTIVSTDVDVGGTGDCANLQWLPLLDPSFQASAAKCSKQEMNLSDRKKIISWGISSYELHPSGRILFPASARIFHCPSRDDRVGITPSEIDINGQTATNAEMCPSNPNLVAYVFGGDIWVKNLNKPDAVPRLVTHSSRQDRLAGYPSFVMQEEFDRYRGFWWQPISHDGKYRILFEEVDETQVETYTFGCAMNVDDAGDDYKFPRAGTANAKSELKLVEFRLDVDHITGVKVKCLSRSLEEDFPGFEYLVRVGWLPEGDFIWAKLLDRPQRTQTTVLISLRAFTDCAETGFHESDTNAIPPVHCQVSSSSGCSKENGVMELMNLTAPHWLNVDDIMFWFPREKDSTDLCFIYASEESGYRHLYLSTAEGKLSEESVTPSEEDCDDEMPCCDDVPTPSRCRKRKVLENKITRRTCVCRATPPSGEENPNEEVWRQSSSTPSYALTWGSWEVAESEIWVDVLNSLVYFTGFKDSPLERHLYVVAIDDPGRVKRLTAAGFSHCVAVHISPTATVVVDLFSNTATPPMCQVASVAWDANTSFGGKSQKVDGLVLALRGYIQGHESVAQFVDPSYEPPEIFSHRIRSGEVLYGMMFKPPGMVPTRKYPTLLAVYGGPKAQLVTNSFKGTVEMKDQVEVMTWLASTRSYIDTTRIGVHGWSYGGYLSLCALIRYPEIFKVAIAAAPVTCWHLYDTAYTERYMDLPTVNPAGYKEGSILSMAHKLPDEANRLLIIHGLMDDNVHFSHTTQLIDALVKAGKPYQLQVYPSERHSLRHFRSNEHYEVSMLHFLEQHLIMAGEEPWAMEEEIGCDIGTTLEAATYHAALNVIIVAGEDRKLHVIDANSDLILHSVVPHRNNDGTGRGKKPMALQYIPAVNKLLVAEGRTIGVRSPHKGAILLDTILQAAHKKTGEGSSKHRQVRIELLAHQEAMELTNFVATLPTTSMRLHVFSELQRRLEALRKAVARRPEMFNKWTTICLDLNADDVRSLCKSCMDSWKNNKHDSSSLSILTAMTERVEWICPTDDDLDEPRMWSEIARRETFSTWPHMDYKWAIPENMAQAGFFHVPMPTALDKVMCFYCDVCLLAWDPSDDPWSEHERHSPPCAFVKGSVTPNVPATLLESAGPARISWHWRDKSEASDADRSVITLVSEPTVDLDASVAHYVATGTRSGNIVVWNTRDSLEPLLEYPIDPKNFIEATTRGVEDAVYFSDSRRGFQLESPSLSNELELASVSGGLFSTMVKNMDTLELTALAVSALPNAGNSTEIVGPVLFAGVSLPTFSQETERNEESGLTYNMRCGRYAYLLAHDLSAEKGFGRERKSEISEPVSDVNTLAAILGTDKLSDVDCIEIEVEGSSNESDDAKFIIPVETVEESEEEVDSESMDVPAASEPIKAQRQYIQCGLVKVPLSLRCETEGLVFVIQDVMHIVSASILLLNLVGYDEVVQSADEPWWEMETTLGSPKSSLLLTLSCGLYDGKLFNEVPVAERYFGTPDGVVSSIHIPSAFEASIGESWSNIEGGGVVVGAKGGAVNILRTSDLVALKTIQLSKPDIMSMFFCHSTNRLCCATKGGSLLYLSSRTWQQDDGATLENGERTAAAAAIREMLVKEDLVTKVIPEVAEAMNCERTLPGMSVVLPTGWTESDAPCSIRRDNEKGQVTDSAARTQYIIVPEYVSFNPTTQRYGQPLRRSLAEKYQKREFYNQSPRLSAIEHTVFEITMPQCRSIGFVEVGFQMNKLDPMPVVQAYLLRNSPKTGSLSSKKQLEQTLDTVSKPSFLEDNSDDIVCGPVDVNEFLDVKFMGGVITFASPQLVANKLRHLCIVLRAKHPVTNDAADGEGKEDSSEAAEKFPADLIRVRHEEIVHAFQKIYNKFNTLKTKITNDSKTNSFALSWVNQVSISIHDIYITLRPEQAILRAALLRSKGFHDRLFVILFSEGNLSVIQWAIEMLSWICGTTWISPKFCSASDVTACNDLLQNLTQNLSSFVEHCVLLASRSVSHYAARIVASALMYLKSAGDQSKFDAFGSAVCNAWADRLLNLGMSPSAGSLNWFFVLLNHVKPTDLAKTMDSCINALVHFSGQKSAKDDYVSQILRTRYGVYEQPESGELYDLQLAKIPAFSFETVGLTLPSFNPVDNGHHSSKYSKGAEFPRPICGELKSAVKSPEMIRMRDYELGDIFDLWKDDSPSKSSCGKLMTSVLQRSSFDLFAGLMEVEPLSFNLVGCSEGTRLEKNGEPIGLIPVPSTEVEHIYHNQKLTSKPEMPTSGVPKNAEPQDEGMSPHEALWTWERLLRDASFNKYVMVVDRLQPGGNRYVVLDFGQPVYLTDIFVPPYADAICFSIEGLASPSRTSGTPIVKANDMKSNAIVLADILTRIPYRYIKVSVSAASKFRIPIGIYFGTSFLMDPLEVIPQDEMARLKSKLDLVRAASAEVYCHYQMSCKRLENAVMEKVPKSTGNRDHLLHFLTRHSNQIAAHPHPLSAACADEDQLVMSAYCDCAQLRQKMSILRGIEHRLSVRLGAGKPSLMRARAISSGAECSPRTDHLKAILHHLIICACSTAGHLKQMNAINLKPSVERRKVCSLLFDRLCVLGWSGKEQVGVVTLLITLFEREAWWGDFLSDALCHYFSNYPKPFPQERVFALLAMMGQQSVRSGNSGVILRLLSKLGNILSQDGEIRGWVLLYLSVCMNFVSTATDCDCWDSGSDDRHENFCNEGKIQRKSGFNFRRSSRWSFLFGDGVSGSEAVSACAAAWQGRGLKRRHAIRGPPQLPKGKFNDAFMKKSYSTAHKRYLQCCGDSLENGESVPRIPEELFSSVKDQPDLNLPKEKCVAACRILINNLIPLNPAVGMDLFMLGCQVLAYLAKCSSPKLRLEEIITQNQLDELLGLAVASVGTVTQKPGTSFPPGLFLPKPPAGEHLSTWMSYTVVTLLVDILEADHESWDSTDEQFPGIDGMTSFHGIVPDSYAIENDILDAHSQAVETVEKMLEDNAKSASLACQEKLVKAFVQWHLKEDQRNTTSDSVEGVSPLTADDQSTATAKFCSSGMVGRAGLNGISTVSSSITRPEPHLLRSTDMHLLNMSVSGFGTQITHGSPFSLLKVPPVQLKVDSVPTSRAPEPRRPSKLNSVHMLDTSFKKLFAHVDNAGISAEKLLLTWLSVNLNLAEFAGEQKRSTGASTGSIVRPVILMTNSALSALLSFVIRKQTVSNRLWSLLFQVLSMTAVQEAPEDETIHGESASWGSFVRDKKFFSFMFKFLSYVPFTWEMNAGMDRGKMEMGKCVLDAFMRLMNCLLSVKIFEDRRDGRQSLRRALLQLTLELIEGPMQLGQGPLDAQFEFFRLVKKQNYDGHDFDIMVSIIEAFATLADKLLQKDSDSMLCLLRPGMRFVQTSEVKRVGSTHGFLPVSSYGSEVTSNHAKQAKINRSGYAASLTELLVLLVSICSNFLFVTKSSSDEFSSQHQSHPQPDSSLTDASKMEQLDASDEALTDESKAAAGADPRENCSVEVCHVVLFRWPTVLKLCGILARVFEAPELRSRPFPEDQETFIEKLKRFMIHIFSRKVPEGLQAIQRYLEGSCGPGLPKSLPVMSEALVEVFTASICGLEVSKKFYETGGFEILGKSLIAAWDESSVTCATQPSIMLQQWVSNRNVRKMQESLGCDLEVEMDSRSNHGLVNIAPLATSVKCDRGDGQSPSLLVRSVAAHRRSRTANWSYTFSDSKNNCVDIVVTLPNPVMIYQVIVTPQASTFSTCPSKVEVDLLAVSSSVGNGWVPVGTAFNKSGSMALRLDVQPARVASVVCIRVYKPIDGNVVGLTQLKIMASPGYAMTNDTISDIDRNCGMGYFTFIAHVMQELQNSLSEDEELGDFEQAARLSESVAWQLTRIPSFLKTLGSVLIATSHPATDRRLFMHNVPCLLVPNVMYSICSFTDVSVVKQVVGILLDAKLPTVSTAAESVRWKPDLMVVQFLERLSRCSGAIISEEEARLCVLKVMMDWVASCSKSECEVFANKTHGVGHSSGQQVPASYVHCLSCILWHYVDCPEEVVRDRITENFVRCVYDWSVIVEGELKQALLFLLCAAVAVEPSCLTKILIRAQLVNSVRIHDPNVASSDDSKGIAVQMEDPLTDDVKSIAEEVVPLIETVLLEPFSSKTSVTQMMSIGLICCSKVGAEFLDGIGLLQQILDYIILFCEQSFCRGLLSLGELEQLHSKNYYELPSEEELEGGKCSGTVVIACLELLKALTSTGADGTANNWLASENGSAFWHILIIFLLRMSMSDSRSEVRSATAAVREENGTSLEKMESLSLELIQNSTWGSVKNCEVTAAAIVDSLEFNFKNPPETTLLAFGISGFMRRLLLEVVLLRNTFLIHLRVKDSWIHDDSLGYIQKEDCWDVERPPIITSNLSKPISHPRFGTGKYNVLARVRLDSTCAELQFIVPDYYDKPVWWAFENVSSGLWSYEQPKTPAINMCPEQDQCEKLWRESRQGFIDHKIKSRDVLCGPTEKSGEALMTYRQDSLGKRNLPELLTFGQLLAALEIRDGCQYNRYLTIHVRVFSRENRTDSRVSADVLASPEGGEEEDSAQNLLELKSIPDLFECFTKCGGLGVLAKQLPLMNTLLSKVTSSVQMDINSVPSLITLQGLSATAVPTVAHGVSVVSNPDQAAHMKATFEETYDEELMLENCMEDMQQNVIFLPMSVAQAGGKTGPGDFFKSKPAVLAERGMGFSWDPVAFPPHILSLMATFLKLQGYAEFFTRNKTKAHCLLRLALGATEDAAGNVIIPTLESTCEQFTFDGESTGVAFYPFQMMKEFLLSLPLHTDDGTLTRKALMETGALNMILSCMAVLSHSNDSGIVVSGKLDELILGALKASIASSGEKSQATRSTASSSSQNMVYYVPSVYVPPSPSTNQDPYQSLQVSMSNAVQTAKKLSGLHKKISPFLANSLKMIKETGYKSLSKTEASDAPSTPIFVMPSAPKKPADAGLYWAKGTGFGTGSMMQSWDADRAFKRLESRERHLAVLFSCLAAFLKPSVKKDDWGEEFGEERKGRLPEELSRMLEQSCLSEAIKAYMRNDSVLDMARHVPLFMSVLDLLEAIAATDSLVHLLLPDPYDVTNSGSHNSIAALLENMHKCVDTYVKTLRASQTATSKNTCSVGVGPREGVFDHASTVEGLILDADDQGLAFLIPKILKTAELVKCVTYFDDAIEVPVMDFLDGTMSMDSSPHLGDTLRLTPQLYVNAMRPLQFRDFEIMKENEDEPGKMRFSVPFHFERDATSSMATGAAGQVNSGRLKRLAQEMVSLSSALPLSYSSSVFVRTDSDRLDVMKVLITGPDDTPYANGIFEFDVFFPMDYPNSPMKVHLQTTGNHTVRFNPNLYNEGRVCLSVLNTWHGRPEERWNPQTSSLLQLIGFVATVRGLHGTVVGSHARDPGSSLFDGVDVCLTELGSLSLGLSVSLTEFSSARSRRHVQWVTGVLYITPSLMVLYSPPPARRTRHGGGLRRYTPRFESLTGVDAYMHGRGGSRHLTPFARAPKAKASPKVPHGTTGALLSLI
ncbi:unnamed protein product [Notodromas monacha]|uniref:DNA-directed RNA polymerase I subunit D n=1 Tax=Notodromas monacha TaxID=399045 RepID=A0A7R9G9N0_9CRUS|nr:unnamed protein product [Notodromas monacha]CAG0913396.1 unnamed protein product [Notodromas monacha]